MAQMAKQITLSTLYQIRNIINLMGIFEYLYKLNVKYPNIPYLYASIGYISQALMHIAFKEVTKTISPFQALFMRALSLFTFNLFLLRNAQKSPYVKEQQTFRLIIKRLMFSTTYAVLILYCVKFLPISTVASLSNISPIFMFFVEAIHYKKPLKKISLIFTLICFSGVILILQPEYLFHQQKATMIEDFEYLLFLAILAAFCFSMTMLYIHDSAKKLDVIVNLHYSYMGHMTLTAILANFQTPIILFDQIDLKLVIAFVFVLIFGLVGQYMIFASTSLLQPSYTMPFGYLAIIVSLIADIFYFQIEFNTLMIIGMALTSVGLISKLFIHDIKEDKYKVKDQHKSKEQKQQSLRGSGEQQFQQV